MNKTCLNKLRGALLVILMLGLVGAAHDASGCPLPDVFVDETGLVKTTTSDCLDASRNPSFYNPDSTYNAPVGDDSDFRNAWRQGYWRAVNDPYGNSRDRFVADLRLNRPYSSNSTGNVNDNAYTGTAATGAYVVYLSDTDTDTSSIGDVGQYVVCTNRKAADNPSAYAFYDCGTNLSGLDPDDGFTTNYSTYGLSNGSRAWFSLDASAAPATHTSGFVCAHRQSFLNTITTNTNYQSQRYTSTPPAPLYLYAGCVDLDAPGSNIVSYDGYQLPNMIYTTNLASGMASRAEVFVNTSSAIGTYGSYKNGFVCKTRLGSSPDYFYTDCDITPGTGTVTGYRISDGFSYVKNNQKHYVRTTTGWQNVANWFSFYRYRALFSSLTSTSIPALSVPLLLLLGVLLAGFAGVRLRKR